jgi:hypothetical protein
MAHQRNKILNTISHIKNTSTSNNSTFLNNAAQKNIYILYLKFNFNWSYQSENKNEMVLDKVLAEVCSSTGELQTVQRRKSK